LQVGSLFGVWRPNLGSGTIELLPDVEHEGYYQCIASNAVGKAVSTKTLVKKAGMPLSSYQEGIKFNPVFGAFNNNLRREYFEFNNWQREHFQFCNLWREYFEFTY